MQGPLSLAEALVQSKALLEGQGPAADTYNRTQLIHNSEALLAALQADEQTPLLHAIHAAIATAKDQLSDLAGAQSMLHACASMRETKQQVALVHLQKSLSKLKQIETHVQVTHLEEGVQANIDAVLNILHNFPHLFPQNTPSGAENIIEKLFHALTTEITSRIQDVITASAFDTGEQNSQEEIRKLIGIMVKSLKVLAKLKGQAEDAPKFSRGICELFLPLLGKFHFHISVADSSNAVLEVTWIFDYAEAFVQYLAKTWALLCPPASVMTLSTGVSIFKLSLQHMLEKVVALIRVKTAKICDGLLDGENLPTPTELMTLVERSLSFDSMLRNMLAGFDSHKPSLMLQHLSDHRTDLISTLSCSLVVCESPELLRSWVHTDRELVLRKLAYSFINGDAWSENVTITSESEMGLNQRHTASNAVFTMACYRGVYDTLWLMRAFMERYSMVPAGYTSMLQREVLQPLLWTLPATLLWRIRSLHKSGEMFRNLAHDIKHGKHTVTTELCSLIDSLHFAERAVARERTDVAGANICEEMWRSTQNAALGAAQMASAADDGVNVSKAQASMLRKVFDQSDPLNVPKTSASPVADYVRDLLRGLRMGIVQEYNDALQVVLDETYTLSIQNRRSMLTAAMEISRDIAQILGRCARSHGVGCAAQSAIGITTAKLINLMFLRCAISSESKDILQSSPKPRRPKTYEYDMTEELNEIARELCSGSYGHVIKISVQRELGMAFDIVKLACMDWKRLEGLLDVLDLSAGPLIPLVFRCSDKDVHIGDLHTATLPTQVIRDSSYADAGTRLTHTLLGNRAHRTYQHRAERDQHTGNALAMDALRSFNIQCLDCSVVAEILRRMRP